MNDSTYCIYFLKPMNIVKLCFRRNAGYFHLNVILHLLVLYKDCNRNVQHEMSMLFLLLDAQQTVVRCWKGLFGMVRCGL